MKKTRLFSSMVSVALLASCSTQHTQAPVVDRGTSSRAAQFGSGTSAAPSLIRSSDQPGYYTVRKGDTVLRIAQEFGQSHRDIATWNNLGNANDIRVDQVLRVAPPDLNSGAPQIGAVTTGSGIDVRPLGSAAATGAPQAQSSTSAGIATSPSVAVVTKIGPRGEKRPYSDSSLVELQKSDAQNYSAPVAVASTTAPTASGMSGVAATTSKPPSQTKTTEIKPAEKTPGSVSAEDENVSWTWPTDGKVAAGFDDGKKGIDIVGKSGQQVLAASGGKVMYAGSGIRGYGNLVIVKHTSNLLSAYAHNKVILVKEGQTVTKGQKIAEMGNSDADGVKLHFEIRQQGKPVDPSKFLPPR